MRESIWNAASEAADGSRGQVENKTRAHALGGMDIKLKKTRVPDNPMGRSRAQRRAGLLYSLVLSYEVRSTSSGHGKNYGKDGETACAST